MDRRERVDNQLIAMRALLKSWQAGIATALPGIYQGAGQTGTAHVQPAIKAVLRDQNGTWTPTNLPVCQDCPIVFPGGGGYQLTWPLADGDEGLIVFSQRCIDAWWQSGGVQPQAELRMHDLSDGFFIPAPLSQAKAPSVVPSTSSAQLRSTDGATYMELASGGVVNIHATTTNIVGNLTISGTLTGPSGAAIAGNLVMVGNVTGGTTSLQTHTHSAVQTGTGVSGPPV